MWTVRFFTLYFCSTVSERTVKMTPSVLLLLVLMASLKSDNVGKAPTLEQIAADLMSSSVNGMPSVSSAMVNDLLTNDRKFDNEELSVNDLQHFTELRPLFDATADGTLTSSAGKSRSQ
jgi:hypothetical protein